MYNKNVQYPSPPSRPSTSTYAHVSCFTATCMPSSLFNPWIMTKKSIDFKMLSIPPFCLTVFVMHMHPLPHRHHSASTQKTGGGVPSSLTTGTHQITLILDSCSPHLITVDVYVIQPKKTEHRFQKHHFFSSSIKNKKIKLFSRAGVCFESRYAPPPAPVHWPVSSLTVKLSWI